VVTSQVSPKVFGGSFGVAVATIFWTVAAVTFWEGEFTDVQLTSLTGATAILVSGFVGYMVPDGLRQEPPASADTTDAESISEV
jgi:hypothetical protein